MCESKFIFSYFYIINFVINNKQDWKGFQSPRLRRIAIGYNVFFKVTWWLTTMTFRISLARVLWESGESLARIWQNTAKIETKKINDGRNKQKNKKKKAGPRRLLLVRSLKNLKNIFCRNYKTIVVSTFLESGFTYL